MRIPDHFFALGWAKRNTPGENSTPEIVLLNIVLGHLHPNNEGE
jgi:hypothetical protein